MANHARIPSSMIALTCDLDIGVMSPRVEFDNATEAGGISSGLELPEGVSGQVLA